VSKFTPTKEDRVYWQGAMDGIALGVAEKIITKEQCDAIRKAFADIPHTHYQSIMGPYCVVCRVGLSPKGEYTLNWEDGQEVV